WSTATCRIWSSARSAAVVNASSNDDRSTSYRSPSCSTSAKTPSAPAGVASRMRTSVAEVSAVVLIRPADQRNDQDHAADEGDPVTDRDTERNQTDRAGKDDRPPAPRAEVPELGVAVVDVGVQPVFRKLATL